MSQDHLIFGMQKWKRSTQIDAFAYIYNTNDERQLAKRMVGMFTNAEIETFIRVLQEEMKKADRWRAKRGLAPF